MLVITPRNAIPVLCLNWADNQARIEFDRTVNESKLHATEKFSISVSLNATKLTLSTSRQKPIQ